MQQVLRWAVVITGLVVVVALIALVAHPYIDTGFGERTYPSAPGQYRPAKTLWDWLQLLIAPAILAILGLLLSNAQHQRDQKRAEAERLLASDRLEDATLQAYLDKMTELLLERKLGTSDASEEVKAVARSRTAAALRVFNVERRNTVLSFLRQLQFLETGKDGSPQNNSQFHILTAIYLGGADLSKTDLSRADLHGANLRRANLTGANLVQANLTQTDLGRAKLTGANLLYADLTETRLSDANLTQTDLFGANLSGAGLDGANLSRTNLGETTLRGAYLQGANLSRTNLGEVNLSGARLQGANLSRAYLNGANLSRADLSGADLRGANLSEANLSEAKYDDNTKWPEGFTPPPEAVKIEAKSA